MLEIIIIVFVTLALLVLALYYLVPLLAVKMLERLFKGLLG